jgi:hypothetical protein
LFESGRLLWLKRACEGYGSANAPLTLLRALKNVSDVVRENLANKNNRRGMEIQPLNDFATNTDCE